jgi:hypothetical protein
MQVMGGHDSMRGEQQCTKSNNIIVFYYNPKSLDEIMCKSYNP